MSVPSSRPSLAVALLAALALALALGPASRAATPSLYANYTSNCTFSWVTDSGAAVGSIAPGTYQLVVFTPFAFSNGLAACETIQFHLTGPGLNFETDLGSGDAEIEQHTVTFQPGGAYAVQDDARPGQTRRTFTVATTGTATGTSIPSTATAPSSGSTKDGTASKDPVGSRKALFRGTLQAAIATNGTVSLKKAAKLVTELKSGRYTFRVVDGSAKAGFTVQLRKGTTKALSTPKYVGTRSVTLALGRGQWSFFTPGGAKHFFVVTK